MDMRMDTPYKLIKLVIVDDEPLVIEGLTSMIDWEKHHIVVTQTFEHAELALEYIAQNPVDLLITDVRMPGMDGLELIQQVKSMQPSLQVLVMSGYRDFEYVKTAMTYGAKNYLVKPVFEEDLSPLLLDIQRDFNSHAMAEYYNNSCQIETLKAYLSDKGSLSDLPSTSLMAYFDEVFAKGNWQVCALWKGFDPIDREIVQSLIDTSLNGWIDLTYQPHSMLVLLNCDLAILEEKLAHQGYISQWYTHSLQHDLVGLKKLYQAYTTILPRCHHYQKTNKIRFSLEPSCENKKLADISIDKIASEFVEILHLFNKELLNLRIEQSLVLLEEMNFSMDLLLSTIILIYEKVVEKTKNLTEINCVSAGVFDINLPLHMCTVEDIALFFESKLLNLLSLLEINKAGSKDSFKLLVDDFVNTHYMENITIKELADYVHMHPTYLGQKLSQLWGEGFTQHLHHIRIQKSVNYMKAQSQLSIEEIACKVGYPHYHVFLKYFKKHMDKTPKDYVRALK